MKFRCSSCGLRIAALHFKEVGLRSCKLTSICDICRRRQRSAQDFANPAVEIFANSLLYPFAGQKIKPTLNVHETFVPAVQKPYLVDARQRKNYEAFIQDYDTNELAQQQISTADFYDAVIASQDGTRADVPDPNIDFAENLSHLGLSINFQLNQVPYISREQIRAKYQYRCQYCGRHGTSVDHKEPVSLSNNNEWSNLILACNECNRIKSNMPYALFKRLNDQIPQVNQKLVKYEQAIASLKGEFESRRRLLSAKVHLKKVVADPELTSMRQQNKTLQDAIDGLQSDYDTLRATRKSYFETGWRLDKAGQTPEII